MNEILTSSPKAWNQKGSNFQIDGFNLTDQNKKDIANFYKVPATLLRIDAEHETSCFKQVAETCVNKVKYRVLGDDSIQVLHPLADYISDAQFESLISDLGVQFQISDRPNGERTATAVLSDSEQFLNDAFSLNAIITRMAQGGISMNVGLLRQICTNGQKVSDKQFNHVFYEASKFTQPVASSMIDTMSKFNIKTYFDMIFTCDGTPYQASVADYISMKNTLLKITDDSDYAESMFPIDFIADFYKSQGIDISSLSNKLLERIPSGLTLYESFNILTHGAKKAPHTLENDILVARQCSPRVGKNKSAVASLQFQGMPIISKDTLAIRMGDVA